MRTAAAGRWIVGILVIVPILLVQLGHLVLNISGDSAAAKLYLLGDYTGLVDWAGKGRITAITRAVTLLLLFLTAVASFFGLGKAAVGGSMLRYIGASAFLAWLIVLLI